MVATGELNLRGELSYLSSARPVDPGLYLDT